MTDKKDTKKKKIIITDNLKPNNTTGKGKPKFNMTYFYVAIILVLFGIQFFSGGSKAVKTDWHTVKQTMIKNGDVEKIIVLNKQKANIYLKKESFPKYEEKLGNGFSKPSVTGPHYFFSFASADKLEENLKAAYEEYNLSDEISVDYDETYDWGGILNFLFPIALIVFFWWFIFWHTYILWTQWRHFSQLAISNSFRGRHGC